MNQINILIIEDSAEEAAALVEILERNHYSVVGVASDLKEARRLYREHSPDFIFIDIFLDGEPDGLFFAEFLFANPATAEPFVFLTNSSDRDIFEQAKKTLPFSYQMKPCNELEVLFAIETAVEQYYDQTKIFKDFLFIKSDRVLKKIVIRDIIYIEVEERYCSVVTHEGKHVALISLTKIQPLLSGDFLRTHRKFIVNVEKIVKITASENLIQLVGGHSVTFGETYKGLLKRFMTL